MLMMQCWLHLTSAAVESQGILSKVAGLTVAEGSNGLQDVREHHILRMQGIFWSPMKEIKKILASPPFAQSCGTYPCPSYLLFATAKQDRAHPSLLQVQNYMALALLLVLARVGSSLFDASLFPIPPSSSSRST